MAEYIREVAVTIEVDTNKQSHQRRLIWQPNETLKEFEQRVTATIVALTER